MYKALFYQLAMQKMMWYKKIQKFAFRFVEISNNTHYLLNSQVPHGLFIVNRLKDFTV